jgi:O-antigen/teichoic acid export membrane protein
LRKIFTNTLIYTIGPQFPKIASLFVLPIITKHLTAIDYGVSGIVMAYTGLLSALKDLGMAVNLSNVFFKHPTKWQIVWRQLHAYLSGWSVLFTVIQGILLYLVIPREALENRWLIILLYSVPALFFEVTITLGTRYYQFSQKPFYMGVVSAFVGSLSIALNLITIAYFKMGYMGWFLSTFIATFVLFLFYFFPLYFKYKLTPIIKFRKKFIGNQLKISLPVIPHAYSSYLLNSSDRVVMNVLGIKLDQLGTYNIAYNFGSYFDFIGNAIGMAVAPVYTKLFVLKQEKILRVMTFMLQYISLAGSFIIALWIKELFRLLIKNTELQAGYSLAIIIVMGYNYRPMYWASVNKLAFYEKTKHLWKISFIAGVINIVLNFIFIPIYGFKVAAITTFIGLMWIGFSGFFLKAYKAMDNENHYHWIWMGAIIAVSSLVYLLRDIPVYYKTIVTTGVVILSISAFLKYRHQLKTIKI